MTIIAEGPGRPPHRSSKPKTTSSAAEPASSGPANVVQRYGTWIRGRLASRDEEWLGLSLVRSLVLEFPDYLSVQDAEILAWLGEQHISDKTRANRLAHIRRFYGWVREQEGQRAGATLRGKPRSQRARALPNRARSIVDVPSGWREPIAAWVRYLEASARPVTTIDLREYQVRRLAVEIGVWSPFKVTGEHLTEWISGKTWSPETTRSYRAALRSFYAWATLCGRVTINPALMLPAIRRPHRVARPAPEDALRAALAACSSRTRLMIELAAQLGLRRGEIAALHTRDIVPRNDGAGWDLIVYGKGRKERVIPLSNSLLEQLRAFPDGWVFPGGFDGHLSPAHVGKLISRALGPGYSTHTLRHRFATVAYAGTRDLFAVQTLLGHSGPETTRLYVRVPDNTLRAAVDAAALPCPSVG